MRDFLSRCQSVCDTELLYKIVWQVNEIQGQFKQSESWRPKGDNMFANPPGNHYCISKPKDNLDECEIDNTMFSELLHKGPVIELKGKTKPVQGCSMIVSH